MFSLLLSRSLASCLLISLSSFIVLSLSIELLLKILFLLRKYNYYRLMNFAVLEFVNTFDLCQWQDKLSLQLLS